MQTYWNKQKFHSKSKLVETRKSLNISGTWFFFKKLNCFNKNDKLRFPCYYQYSIATKFYK